MWVWQEGDSLGPVPDVDYEVTAGQGWEKVQGQAGGEGERLGAGAVGCRDQCGIWMCQVCRPQSQQDPWVHIFHHQDAVGQGNPAMYMHTPGSGPLSGLLRWPSSSWWRSRKEVCNWNTIRSWNWASSCSDLVTCWPGWRTTWSYTHSERPCTRWWTPPLRSTRTYTLYKIQHREDCEDQLDPGLNSVQKMWEFLIKDLVELVINHQETKISWLEV